MAKNELAADIKSVEDGLLAALTPMLAPMGMSPIFGRIMFTLIFSPEPITMRELSQRTGYSLSSLSTNLKMLVGIGKVHQETRPGSKKLYFSVMTLELGKALLILLTRIPDMANMMRASVRKAKIQFEELKKKVEGPNASPEVLADLEYRITALHKLEKEYTKTIEIFDDVHRLLEEKHGIPRETSYEALRR